MILDAGFLSWGLHCSIHIDMKNKFVNLLSYLEKIGQTITIIKLNILNTKKGDSASAQ